VSLRGNEQEKLSSLSDILAYVVVLEHLALRITVAITDSEVSFG